MIVQSLQEAEQVLNERWDAKTQRERAEIKNRYETLRRMRKNWKHDLKPIFDKLLGDNKSCV
jgi:hypothetical protein